MSFFESIFWENAQDVSRPIPGLVSVVICCRNGENHLREAIASILVQTYGHYEIVIIDNDSEDSTPAIAAEYAQVRYFCHDNQGLVRSRNRSIQESRGEYIVFLDHDDRLLPNALEDGVKAFTQHRDHGFVFGRECLIQADGSFDYYLSLKESKRYAQKYDYPTLLLGCHYISPMSSVLFRRDILVAVGGFDPAAGMPDDAELYLRIARQYPVYCHRRVVAEYRQHRGSQMHTKLIRFQTDLRRVLNSQKPYVQGNPVYKKALRRGKLNAEYMYTVRSIFNIATEIGNGNWKSAFSLGWTIFRFPILTNCLLICLFFVLERRRFERSQPPITASLEFAKVLAESEPESSDVRAAVTQEVGF